MTDVTPLFGLRLRTPRLELRAGSPDEILALAELAQHGVHPPEEMPFMVPWTDGIGEPGFVDGFVAYHLEQLSAWSPDDWHLPLLVWLDGSLVGEQSLFGKDVAASGEVSTGSWLGAAFQRQGIGTEMRCAVLELAFSGLRARVAVSAWLEGNDASRRVSEKLGYVPCETRTESPRGTPVTAQVMRLERASWRSPVPVVIEGLEAALHLLVRQPPSDFSAPASD